MCDDYFTRHGGGSDDDDDAGDSVEIGFVYRYAVSGSGAVATGSISRASHHRDQRIERGETTADLDNRA
jgi:hypothetical protein